MDDNNDNGNDNNDNNDGNKDNWFHADFSDVSDRMSCPPDRLSTLVPLVVKAVLFSGPMNRYAVNLNQEQLYEHARQVLIASADMAQSSHGCSVPLAVIVPGTDKTGPMVLSNLGNVVETEKVISDLLLLWAESEANANSGREVRKSVYRVPVDKEVH